MTEAERNIQDQLNIISSELKSLEADYSGSMNQYNDLKAQLEHAKIKVGWRLNGKITQEQADTYLKLINVIEADLHEQEQDFRLQYEKLRALRLRFLELDCDFGRKETGVEEPVEDHSTGFPAIDRQAEILEHIEPGEARGIGLKIIPLIATVMILIGGCMLAYLLSPLILLPFGAALFCFSKMNALKQCGSCLVYAGIILSFGTVPWILSLLIYTLWVLMTQGSLSGTLGVAVASIAVCFSGIDLHYITMITAIAFFVMCKDNISESVASIISVIMLIILSISGYTISYSIYCPLALYFVYSICAGDYKEYEKRGKAKHFVSLFQALALAAIGFPAIAGVALFIRYFYYSIRTVGDMRVDQNMYSVLFIFPTLFVLAEVLLLKADWLIVLLYFSAVCALALFKRCEAVLFSLLPVYVVVVLIGNIGEIHIVYPVFVIIVYIYLVYGVRMINIERFLKLCYLPFLACVGLLYPEQRLLFPSIACIILELTHVKFPLVHGIMTGMCLFGMLSGEFYIAAPAFLLCLIYIMRRFDKSMIYDYNICILSTVYVYCLCVLIGLPSWAVSLTGIALAVCYAYVAYRFKRHKFLGYSLVLSLTGVVKFVLFDIDYTELTRRAVGYIIGGALCFVIFYIFNKIEKEIKQ